VLSKISKQQRLILNILEEENGEIYQRTLTRRVADELGKMKHLSKQEMQDHALKVLREADDNRERRLLSLLLIGRINSMRRGGEHYVTDSGRASICRSIRRLEERGLVRRTLFGDVYLASKFPERYRKDKNRHDKIMREIEERNG